MKLATFQLVTVLFLAFGLLFARGAGQPLVDDTRSPFAHVHAIGLSEARWTGGFWGDRYELCRTIMIPSLQRLMKGTNFTQFYVNFQIAAGLQPGRSHGASFNDGEFYKLLEAVSATLAVTNDPILHEELDAEIAVIGQAQRTNGYLDTWVQLHARDAHNAAVPFRDRNNFEVYNLGQLFTSAVVNYRATGQTNFLAIACRAADCLATTFENPTTALAVNVVCPAHYMGLVELYRATGEPKYLALAKKFLAMRALDPDGGSDNQERVALADQLEAEGHAVRANYFYAGVADVFLETGDPGWFQPVLRVWTNVVTKKMYITGGCGALYDGAAPDGGQDQKNITRVHQAYGRNFQLPNLTAHNETCANIGNALWNWRMFLATGEARYMDVVELEFYNSVLSGVALDGTNFFYTNPLRVVDPLPVSLRWPRQRVPFVSSFCCPPNLVRTIAESVNYAYAKSDSTLWVNLYGKSSLVTEIAGGQLQLTQETDYPWNGRVRIKIASAGPQPFALKLRIPGWASAARVRLNLAPADNYGPPGSYLELRRIWQAGDVVDLDLPMPVRLMAANPNVEEDINQLAVQRGPVVYCLESPDLPPGVKISDVLLPANGSWTVRYDPHLLGGVVVLQGSLLTRPRQPWSGQLYQPYEPAQPKPVPARLIPYSVWQNRGPSEMSVWLPRAD